MVSDKALALGLCRKRIPTKKAVKQVKYLLGGKKSVVHVDKHMGRLRERERERELSPQSSLNHFYGAFLLSFL